MKSNDYMPLLILGAAAVAIYLFKDKLFGGTTSDYGGGGAAAAPIAAAAPVVSVPGDTGSLTITAPTAITIPSYAVKTIIKGVPLTFSSSGRRVSTPTVLRGKFVPTFILQKPLIQAAYLRSLGR